jgi:imidazolonepropionase-like amidohydrolase
MPGLINMHVHLAGNGKPQKKQRDNTALVKKLFSNHVTAALVHQMVRDFAGNRN